MVRCGLWILNSLFIIIRRVRSFIPPHLFPRPCMSISLAILPWYGRTLMIEGFFFSTTKASSKFSPYLFNWFTIGNTLENNLILIWILLCASFQTRFSMFKAEFSSPYQLPFNSFEPYLLNWMKLHIFATFSDIVSSKPWYINLRAC